jgi:hypothetical protein
VPVALSMGGGYGHRIEETVAVQLQTWREALCCWRAWQSRRQCDSPASDRFV